MKKTLVTFLLLRIFFLLLIGTISYVESIATESFSFKAKLICNNQSYTNAIAYLYHQNKFFKSWSKLEEVSPDEEGIIESSQGRTFSNDPYIFIDHWCVNGKKKTVEIKVPRIFVTIGKFPDPTLKIGDIDLTQTGKVGYELGRCGCSDEMKYPFTFNFDYR